MENKLQLSCVKISNSDLKKFFEVFVGEWKRDVTLVADEDSFGKKGDNLDGQQSVIWILDGAALRITYRIGTMNGNAIISWDNNSQRILCHMVSTAGIGQHVFSKQGDRWIIEGLTGLSQTEIALEDHGLTQVHYEAEKQGFAPDTWRRVELSTEN